MPPSISWTNTLPKLRRARAVHIGECERARWKSRSDFDWTPIERSMEPNATDTNVLQCSDLICACFVLQWRMSGLYNRLFSIFMHRDPLWKSEYLDLKMPTTSSTMIFVHGSVYLSVITVACCCALSFISTKCSRFLALFLSFSIPLRAVYPKNFQIYCLAEWTNLCTESLANRRSHV